MVKKKLMLKVVSQASSRDKEELVEELNLQVLVCIMFANSFLTQTHSVNKQISLSESEERKLSSKVLEMSDSILPRKCIKKELRLLV